MEISGQQLRELLCAEKTGSPASNTCFEIGMAYLIRTVTHYYLGRLKCITPGELLLADASWIADTGRFHECLEKGVANEVEPYVNDCIVMRGAIVDATKWNFELPKGVK